MLRNNRRYALVLTSVVCLILLAACGSKKDIVYFQNASSFETMVDTDTYVSKFKVGDIVGIHVSTLDADASRPFNLSGLTLGSGEGSVDSGNPGQVDYLIDRNGNIEFPVLGTLKIQGLSPAEVKDMLREKLSADYLNNPIINVRLKSFKVTVLGEVRSPGTFLVTGERITILEALGLAGDLTIKGMRKNVLVIRDFNGTKVYTRIDLTKKEVMKSPVFYLTQNDVIYVEPNKSAVSASTLDNRVSLIFSILTLASTVTLFLVR